MRMLSVLLSLAFVGCIQASQTRIRVDVVDAPSWAVHGMNGAIAIWAEHGIDVEVESGAPLSIHVLAPDAIYDGTAWGDFVGDLGSGRGQLNLASDTPTPTLPFFQDCVIAHEIGHAIGMQHVADSAPSSLMSTTIAYKFRGTAPGTACFWSAADDAEMARVFGYPETCLNGATSP